MKKDNYGICHICGQVKELTFEHLPPKKANNSNRVKAIVGDELMKHIAGNNMPWDFSGHQYKNMQRGMGTNSICKECNNNTGWNYVNEYIKFANIIGYVINNKIKDENVEGFTIQLKDIYVLRIIKQIYTMFASTLPELYVSNRPDLQKFILDKNFNDVDWSKYRLSVFAMKEGFNSWSGITSLLMGNGTNNEVKTVAVMNLYPLGFILEFDPKGECKNTDITHLADGLNYDSKCFVELSLYLRSVNSIYPFDYRTKDEIEEDMVKSRAKTIQMYSDMLKEKDRYSDEAIELIKKYKQNEITVGEFSVKVHQMIDGDNNK